MYVCREDDVLEELEQLSTGEVPEVETTNQDPLPEATNITRPSGGESKKNKKGKKTKKTE